MPNADDLVYSIISTPRCLVLISLPHWDFPFTPSKYKWHYISKGWLGDN